MLIHVMFIYVFFNIIQKIVFNFTDLHTDSKSQIVSTYENYNSI